MNRLFILCALILCCSACQEPLNTSCNIIPAPQQVIQGNGNFEIGDQTYIAYADVSMQATAEMLQSYIAEISGKKLRMQLNEKPEKHSIYLKKTEDLADEAYRLSVKNKKIVCEATTETGMFYAIQSLVQLTNATGQVMCMEVIDAPRYGWRGMMLDESRHFFGKETVKQQLDIMARLKMNRYHWHLTDEMGWRIEIKQYPLLTEVGGIGNWSDRNAPATFYTQDDIREIIAYAHQRHIMVIPEIDMPGHATAVAKAYPYLSAGGTGRWAGFTFHPAKETTYEFINDVLTEVAALFPAPYIHIGGDEVHFGNQTWFTDPVIQKFIKDNKLENEVGLEHYFVRRACDMVSRLGKTMIGWDEILASGVTPDNAIIMWWRHDKVPQAVQALNEGFRVILTPRIPCYFDFVQDDSQKTGRRWAGAFNTLPVTYQFPDSLVLQASEQQVLGMQANIWTERIADKKRLDYMTFPRLAAIAEAAWTEASQKDYADFEERIKPFLKYLDGLGIYYFNPFDKASTPEPWGPETADVAAEG